MDHIQFDALTRLMGRALPRRAAPPLLGGIIAALLTSADPAMGKKKKKKKKKATLCLDGQTIQASKKKKKKFLKSGATPGECPPPPICIPNCPGTACGGDDGCGGICGCGVGSLCHAGFCRTCTVTCNGDGGTCGNLLQAELAKGGRVYVCPGRYAGNFTLSANVELVGAGDGEDPAGNTVLDGNLNGSVMTVAPGVVAEMHRLRIFGGNTPNAGGGVYNEGSLALTACTVSKNTSEFGGGGIIHALNATGPLTLNSCTVKDNAGNAGGGIAVVSRNLVTLTNCIISGNKATVDGGGISLLSGTVTINGGEVTGNTAANGGGIFNERGTVNLSGASVTGNDPNNCAGTPVTGCVG